uniref:Uncharacterized protein n=1 Tax=Avena sativa TaxID=4498 RepID=A0ACD5XG38_AVESA
MEGLIPFIYRAIKERKTRSYSYSRCSSAGSARGFGAGAGGVEEGDVWGEERQWKGDGAAGRDQMMTHRRHRSLEELAGEVGGAAPEWRADGRLRRGKSSRIFSCIGGM